MVCEDKDAWYVINFYVMLFQEENLREINSQVDTILAKIKFEENGKFELIEDNFYDCTPTFSIYGRGEYQIIEDSILFVFDSIPHLKSECRIDSTNNNDEYSNLYH